MCRNGDNREIYWHPNDTPKPQLVVITRGREGGSFKTTAAKEDDDERMSETKSFARLSRCQITESSERREAFNLRRWILNISRQDNGKEVPALAYITPPSRQ